MPRPLLERPRSSADRMPTDAPPFNATLAGVGLEWRRTEAAGYAA